MFWQWAESGWYLDAERANMGVGKKRGTSRNKLNNPLVSGSESTSSLMSFISLRPSPEFANFLVTEVAADLLRLMTCFLPASLVWPMTIPASVKAANAAVTTIRDRGDPCFGDGSFGGLTRIDAGS